LSLILFLRQIAARHIHIGRTLVGKKE